MLVNTAILLLLLLHVILLLLLTLPSLHAPDHVLDLLL